MILSLVLGFIIVFQEQGIDGCLPRRTKELTDSYVPVGIQVLHHYKTQLQMLYPYKFTPFCRIDEQNTAISKFPLTTDICVEETLARINIFLIDLQREAVKQNLEETQGLTRSVIFDIEKTSEMSAAQQFHFILKKLQKERIGTKTVAEKIRKFLQDLENSNSKFYRNFLNLKPLHYFK